MDYINLTLEERKLIENLKNTGLKQYEIAEQLNRASSTISREIGLNSHLWYGYIADYAHLKAKLRKCGQKKLFVLDSPEVFESVKSGLEKGWSPDVISGRMKKEKCKQSISTESIYRLIYHDHKKGGGLWELLYSARKRRKQRLGRPDQRGKIEGRVSIDERPASVMNRTRFGHWEGDTIIGKQHKGAMFTGVERKSRYIVAWNAMKKEANRMSHSISQAFKLIPKNLVKTITVDNGHEFSGHKKIARNLNARVFFAHPGRPDEKGSIENANRLLRKYFPKGTDIRGITHWTLKMVVDEINNTPRKVLNYLTPKEVFLNGGKIAL